MKKTFDVIIDLLKNQNILPTEAFILFDAKQFNGEIPSFLKDFLNKENISHECVKLSVLADLLRLTIKDNFDKLERIYNLPIEIVKIGIGITIRANKLCSIYLRTDAKKSLLNVSFENYSLNKEFDFYEKPMEVDIEKEDLLVKIINKCQKLLKKQEDIDTYKKNITNYLESKFKSFLTGNENIFLSNKSRLFFYVALKEPLTNSQVELAFKKDKLMGVKLDTWGDKNIEKLVENIFK